MKPKRNWRTTFLGIATIVVASAGVVANPATALQQDRLSATIAAITAGAGLIAAKDSKEEKQ